jgi:aspartyl-tRNA(Asn)/glutamyl-tRNA(Gln) amidotransferase subunit C
MTEISTKQIDKIAKLAHIALSDEQKEQFSSQISEIISWVESLNEIVDDSIHVDKEKSLRLRDDKVKLGNSADEVLKNSPNRKYDFYTVPKFVAND